MPVTGISSQPHNQPLSCCGYLEVDPINSYPLIAVINLMLFLVEDMGKTVKNEVGQILQNPS